MEARPFGRMLLDLNIITEEQLEKAIQLQTKGGDTRPLGEVLLHLGYLDEKTLNSVLQVQSRHVRVDKVDAAFERDDLEKSITEGGLIDILKIARECDASDVYVGSHEAPAMRVNGSVHRFPVPAMEAKQAEKFLREVLTDDQVNTLNTKRSVDFVARLPHSGRFRLNVFKHRRGVSGVFRFIREEIWPFENLKLPPVVKELGSKSNGLVLITGPTGCGKSTTMASIIDYVNRNFRRHIITIEDPIEVIHDSQKSLVSQRELNTHTTSYAQALRAALREDPDVLVVGEMRDAETVATAITAAETGHLVFGTLHTQNSHRTIVRILDQFPAGKRSNVRTILSTTLRGVVSQQLVPGLDGRERHLAYEVLVVNNAISNLIREDKVHQIPSSMQTGHHDGMCLMDDSLLQLVKKGKIAHEEAYARAVEKEKFSTPDHTL